MYLLKTNTYIKFDAYKTFFHIKVHEDKNITRIIKIFASVEIVKTTWVCFCNLFHAKKKSAISNY